MRNSSPSAPQAPLRAAQRHVGHGLEPLRVSSVFPPHSLFPFSVGRSIVAECDAERGLASLSRALGGGSWTDAPSPRIFPVFSRRAENGADLLAFWLLGRRARSRRARRAS